MTIHSCTRLAAFCSLAVVIGIFSLGCGKRYQELAVEKTGRVAVMLPKMSHPLVYPEFSQEELNQASNDYALSLRRDIHAALAKRLDVLPDEKVDDYLKANNLYGIHLDHEDSLNAARKCDGDIVVESYVRLIPVDRNAVVAKRRGYDTDVEVRLTDVWNTDTLVVFKFTCKRDEFVEKFTCLVARMKIHEAKKK